MASLDRPPAPPKRPPPDQQQADLVTYKRRRFRPASPFATMPPSCGNSKKNGREPLARHWISWRDTLEGFLQSPGVSQGGGIQNCIRDALRYNVCQPLRQASLANCQGAAKEDPDDAAEDKMFAASAAIEDAAAACLEANKAMCNYALLNILVSEKFALLCHLLVGTFHVNKPVELIDLEKVDAKMRNGDYAQNPALFDNDIQQMWEKFELVGQQMTDLASNLSTISRVSYQKQASGFSEVEVAEHRTEEISLAGVAHIVTKESTITMQLTPCDSSQSTIPKRTVPPGVRKFCAYNGCAAKVDDEEGLICDECDAIYHFACVKLLNPDIEQVPAIFHCSSCSFKKKESDADTTNNVGHDSLHDAKCNLCGQLELTISVENPKPPSRIELTEEREGSSVSSMGEGNEPGLSTTALSKLCKHCGTCEDDDKKFVVCGHPYCVYKYYHIRCLKASQLALEQQKKLGRWYCPSCLCRGCFQDKDDDNIVMCDGCDEGYHIYCMRPVRQTIPKGKWYCTFCKIRRANEGMHKYENSVLEMIGNINQSKVSQGDGTEK